MAAKDDYDALSELCSRLFDDDDTDGRDKWINAHMQRLGHKPSVSWVDSDNSDGSKDDFVSNLFGNKKRETRQVGGSRQQSRGDWQYGSGS